MSEILVLSMKECNAKIIMRFLMIARSFIWSVNWNNTLHSRKEDWVNTLHCSGSATQSFRHLLSNEIKLQPMCWMWVGFDYLLYISLSFFFFFFFPFFCICICICVSCDEILFFFSFPLFQDCISILVIFFLMLI